MSKTFNTTALGKYIQEKITNDVVSIMRENEMTLYNMLNDVIESRVYNAYDPVKYKRTYKLKNAITHDMGYEQSSNFGKSRIVSRVYIDERKMEYSNHTTRVPRRIDDDRVKRRADRWLNPERSSHFMTTAYTEFVDIASKLESNLLLKGYIKK